LLVIIVILMEGFTDAVRIVSRRLVRPEPVDEGEPHQTMHLTPWDLRMLTLDYIQEGLLLRKPPAPAGVAAPLADGLVSSLAHTLARFYPLAGRLAVEDASPGIVVSLRCNGEGAEFVRAEAPEVTVAELTGHGYYIPSSLVRSLFPFNGMLGTDAALDGDSFPVLAAQVTELADGVFVAMSLNHAVADGTTFWHLFNSWSEISRRMMTMSDGCCCELSLSTPRPVLDRWFLETSPVPIPLPFSKLEDIVRRPAYPPVRECFFHFSAESVRNLKAKANAEMAGTAKPTAIVLSSLQSVLAHLWRASCRARELPSDRETTLTLLVGCRPRVKGIPQEYMGNSVTTGDARSTVGELLSKGLGWAAWLLNRVVAAFDEASVRDDLASWPRDPKFTYVQDDLASIVAGNSPRFDVYGNDFGWGRPVAVRSGAANKLDGMVNAYEGCGGAGSIALEVCLAPKALARLVADKEFMEAVSADEA
jgi:hypothetical protein